MATVENITPIGSCIMNSYMTIVPVYLFVVLYTHSEFYYCVLWLCSCTQVNVIGQFYFIDPQFLIIGID